MEASFWSSPFLRRDWRTLWKARGTETCSCGPRTSLLLDVDHTEPAEGGKLFSCSLLIGYGSEDPPHQLSHLIAYDHLLQELAFDYLSLMPRIIARIQAPPCAYCLETPPISPPPNFKQFEAPRKLS